MIVAHGSLHGHEVGVTLVLVAVLGAVFLTLTGGESLYADMGHFGRKPIRIAWIGFIFPALLCNYFGQAAFTLSIPSAITEPLLP